jgi:hypothetical protein
VKTTVLPVEPAATLVVGVVLVPVPLAAFMVLKDIGPVPALPSEGVELPSTAVTF